MSYTNVYPSRINWENEPSIASPINATNLNKIDYAVYEHDQTFETWDVTKANQSDLLLSVKSIDYNTSTGVFVFTWQNGTTKTVDLNIEKIPVSFSMSAQGVITMTTEDGTQYTADVGSLIKTYTFTDSTEIDFTVTTDASGNKTVTAALKDGSIVGTKLEPNYLANCQSAANSASGSATAADGSAEDSEAWAVGTRDGVPVPSTDPAYNNNSKYWATQGGANSLAGLSDTDINSPTDGQGLVYNYSTSKWINGNVSSGSTITVFTNESSLYGRTVTLTIGQQTKTETFSNVGVAVFKGIVATGTFTITSSTSGGDTATATLDVPYFGNYTKQLTLFSATVTITYPRTEGATCTISDGVTTLTANASPMAFDIPNSGTWVATCTLDGLAQTQSFTITTDGQTETHTFEYGTINLTFDNEFRGLTLTCTDSSYTITKTAPSTGNTMVFYPNESGTWVISSIYSGETYTTTVTVSSLSTPVSASLETIPNGSTVTPTDSIQTWLKCAGLNKNYTTLSEVLNDEETYRLLLEDSNACDYMARSTTWASTLVADADAMTTLGKYDYACNALLGNSTWASAINQSSYANYIIDTSVPTMTGYTTPSGEVSASSEYSGTPDYISWGAFNSSRTNGYCPDKSDASPWIQYDFGKKVNVTRVDTKGVGSASSTVYTATLKGSNDGSTFTAINNAINITFGGTSGTYTFANGVGYRYYRLELTSNTSGRYYDGYGFKLQFYGHETNNNSNCIYTAPRDEIYYKDNGSNVVIGTADDNGVVSVNWSNIPSGDVVIYSSTAKNPDSLSSDYSKTIKNTPNKTEAYLMPDKGVLYWWGYMSSDAEDCTTANGWGGGSGYTLSAPTHNINDIYAQATSSHWCAIGTKTSKSNKTFKTITSNVTGSSGYVMLRATSKSDMTVNNGTTNPTSASLALSSLDATSISNAYVFIGGYSGKSCNISAFWYE